MTPIKPLIGCTFISAAAIIKTTVKLVKKSDQLGQRDIGLSIAGAVVSVSLLVLFAWIAKQQKAKEATRDGMKDYTWEYYQNASGVVWGAAVIYKIAMHYISRINHVPTSFKCGFSVIQLCANVYSVAKYLEFKKC